MTRGTCPIAFTIRLHLCQCRCTGWRYFGCSAAVRPVTVTVTGNLYSSSPPPRPLACPCRFCISFTPQTAPQTTVTTLCMAKEAGSRLRHSPCFSLKMLNFLCQSCPPMPSNTKPSHLAVAPASAASAAGGSAARATVPRCTANAAATLAAAAPAWAVPSPAASSICADRAMQNDGQKVAARSCPTKPGFFETVLGCQTCRKWRTCKGFRQALQTFTEILLLQEWSHQMYIRVLH